jgi:hypothetical protein
MYDENSGQVFRERTARRVKVSPPPRLDWSRRPMYSVFRARSGRGVMGPRSLVEMAINVVADNIGEASEKHLDGTPTKQQWRIWRFLEAR